MIRNKNARAVQRQRWHDYRVACADARAAHRRGEVLADPLRLSTPQHHVVVAPADFGSLPWRRGWRAMRERAS